MTSRERIRATFEHRMPDMLPIDFAGHRSSGVSAIAYNRLKAHLGLSQEDTKLYDIMQQLAYPELDMVDRFGGDVVQILQLYPAFNARVDTWKKGVLQDGSPCLEPGDLNPVQNEKGDFIIYDKNGVAQACQPKGGLYYDNVNYYLKDVEDIDDLKATMVKPSITDEELDFIEKQAKELYETTDKATLLHVGGAVFEAGQQAFGFENFYYLLAAEPEVIHCWAENLTEGYIEILDKLLTRIGPYLDIAWFGGDDLGTQVSPQLSTQMYREMIKPYQSQLYHFVKKKSPTTAVGLHCCGSIAPLMGDLIDAGVEILNPIQISARNMDPETLKREFGKNLVFWGGGADMQGFVRTHDDPKEIYRHARELIDIFAPEGNFVFTQVHNILADVAPEKIIAIYQAALDYRKECGC
ncbi:MAG: methyltransferase [Clostridia bacterium]|nr:methyltransferase [Clostridia bacterium]